MGDVAGPGRLGGAAGAGDETEGGHEEVEGEHEELAVKRPLDETLPLDAQKVDDDVLDEVEVGDLGTKHDQVQGGLGLQLPGLKPYNM